MKEYISYSVVEEEIHGHEGDVVGAQEYWLIEAVYVPVANRGQGVARKLMAEAIAEMQSERPDLAIRLWCEPQDSSTCAEKLAEFYEGLGFSPTGNDAEMEMS